MPSVLIIDDSATVRREIVRTLKEFSLFDVYHEADDGLAGFKSLLDHPVDLVLCDLEMPLMDGFKFLALVATREDLRAIPVIILTGRGDREMKIRGLEQGASDYVTKPFDTGELVARVKVQLKIKSLQDELKQSNLLLREMAITDQLTSLYNRHYLLEVLEREMPRTARKGGSLSVVMLDIDHFKKVNDIYGHQTGDGVLATVALLVKNGLRNYDTAARYGGEEFLVVLPDTTLTEAFVVAERIRRQTEELTFSEQLKELKITVSLGIAIYPSKTTISLEALFHEADMALYRAKTGGRNRIEAAGH